MVTLFIIYSIVNILIQVPVLRKVENNKVKNLTIITICVGFIIHLNIFLNVILKFGYGEIYLAVCILCSIWSYVNRRKVLDIFKS